MINKKNIEDILILTPMQEGMLFHYLRNPGYLYYFEQLILTISGKIDIQCFEEAWNAVIQTNEMLRTVFRWEKVKNPIQIILKEHKLQWVYHDLSKIYSSETERHLKEIQIKDREEQFDLGQVPFRVTLCKVEENKYEMIISNHHILYDGWSNGIILKEFFNSYNSLVKENQLLEPSVKGKFKEFVKWNQNQDQNKQDKFWENYFDGFDTQIDLPIKRMAQQPKAPVFTNYHLVLEKPVRDQLEIFIMENRVTLSAFFYCTWAIVLQKYCNIDDVVFGTTVSGRSAPIKGIEDMVGLFINLLPLRVKTVQGEKILELLLKINKSLPYRETYENTPLVDIKTYRGLGVGQELFDSIVVVENYPLDSRLMLENSEIFVDSYSLGEGTHYDLTIGIGIFDSLELRFTFNNDLFDESTIVRLGNHFMNTIEKIIKNPEEEVFRLEIISKEEKSQILLEFNDTIDHYSINKLIHELFEEQSGRALDRTAVVGNHETPAKHEKGSTHITYRELTQRSCQLAYVLREKGVKPDTIVGIMIERSLEMIIGIIGVLKAGGAYLPLDPVYPEERIDFMLKDSNAKVLVITRSLSEKIAFERDIVCLEDYKGFPPASNYPTTSNEHRAASLAYIIYTSGTTGNPKAVMIRHQSVINLVLGLSGRVYDFNGEAPVNVSLISSYVFDASVKQIFPSLLLGHTLIIVPEEARMNGMALLELYKKKDIQVSDGTPIHMDIILNCERELSNRFPVRKFVIGGDELGLHRVRRLNEIIDLSRDDFDLVNVYGPTECCDVTTSYHVTGETIKACQRIPIGTPLSNVRVYIMGNHRGLQGVGVPGELCIAGDGLARGYLNRVGETAEKFIINPFIRGERLYCSGDLARWLPDGNIEFLGRKDQQVKIRGFRVELGEIESQLQRHNGVKEAVVLAIGTDGVSDDNNEKYLCAYVVPGGAEVLKRKNSLSKELIGYLTKTLPNFMIPGYFMPLEQIPLLPNGKLNKIGLPKPEISPVVKSYVPPRNEIEKKLVEIWRETLGIKRELVGIDSNFVESGGYSLKAITLVSRIHKELNVLVPLAEIFEISTIRKLSGYIKKNAAAHKHVSIERTEEKEYYALSSEQKRLYILHLMENVGTSYNLPTVMEIETELNLEKLEEAFVRLIKRHESLRTSFEVIEGEMVQRIHKENNKLQITKYKQILNCKLQITNIIKNFIRPFDLSKAPLLRVGLMLTHSAPSDHPYQEGNNKGNYLLMVYMHHIISDGISLEIFQKEFIGFYDSKQLTPLNIQYKDYSEWQQGRARQTFIKQQESYWLKEFEGEISPLDLPTDYARPVRQCFEGDAVDFTIGKGKTRCLRTLASEENVTLFMILLAIYNVLLSRICEQEDIIVGTPVVGRNHTDLESIIGMFVNILVLKNFLKESLSFKVFLKGVKQKTLKAFENGDYQLEELVEELNIERDLSRNPLFDVVFSFQNIGPQTPSRELDLTNQTGLQLKPYKFPKKITHFDLMLFIRENPHSLAMMFEYSTSLFKRSTIEEFQKYYIEILDQVLEDRNILLKEIKLSHDWAAIESNELWDGEGDFGF